MTIRLNVGCGATEIMDGWVNMDVREYPGVDFVADVLDRDTLLDRFYVDTVDEFRSAHMFEHLTGHEFLQAFENLWYVARDGAKMTAIVPYGQSNHFWRDPDHVRPLFFDSFNCTTQPYWERCDIGYRGDWRVDRVILRPEPDELPRARVDSGLWLRERALKLWNCVSEMCVELTAVKPLRPRLDSAGANYRIVVDKGLIE